MLPTASSSFSLGGLDDAEALGVQDVRAGADLGERRFLGRGRVEPAVDEVTLTSTSGFCAWAPAMKALVMRFTSGTG